MLIDWFTVAAQVVNFLILALLLRKFLYKPVMNAIAQRKQKIERELAEAESIRQDALKTKATYEEKVSEFEKRQEQRKEEVLKTLDEERKRRLADMQKEIDEQKSHLIRAFREQEKAIYDQIAQRAHEEVFQLARKALSDLASKDLETFITEEFIRRLKDPDPLEHQKLKQTLNSDQANLIVIRSAYTIEPNEQRTITKTLSRTLDLDRLNPRFEVKPDLLCGIEIQINHYKLEWHVAGYLEATETS